MDEKSNFGMKITEGSVRRKRDLDEISHAADINEDLVRTFFREASAKLANHGTPVLPPFLRLSIELKTSAQTKSARTATTCQAIERR
jgi:hypothetical protein